MRRMEPWNHTVKLYHYKEFMDTISHIIDSTSMEARETNREITIPRLQRMKNRTFYIRNTHPELARGIQTIADCLIDLYSYPSLLHDFYTLRHFLEVSLHTTIQKRRGKTKRARKPQITSGRTKTSPTSNIHRTHQQHTQHVDHLIM